MVDVIYGSETTMIYKKTLVFVQRINTFFNSSFLDFDHALNDLQFYKL